MSLAALIAQARIWRQFLNTPQATTVLYPAQQAPQVVHGQPAEASFLPGVACKYPRRRESPTSAGYKAVDGIRGRILLNCGSAKRCAPLTRRSPPRMPLPSGVVCSSVKSAWLLKGLAVLPATVVRNGRVRPLTMTRRRHRMLSLAPNCEKRNHQPSSEYCRKSEHSPLPAGSTNCASILPMSLRQSIRSAQMDST